MLVLPYEHLVENPPAYIQTLLDFGSFTPLGPLKSTDRRINASERTKHVVRTQQLINVAVRIGLFPVRVIAPQRFEEDLRQFYNRARKHYLLPWLRQLPLNGSLEVPHGWAERLRSSFAESNAQLQEVVPFKLSHYGYWLPCS